MGRVARSVGGFGFALVASACYSSAPIDLGVSPPAAGDMIALDISDQGRVALGERLGPGVTTVEGRLAAMTSTSFDVLVNKVAFLRGGESRWSGEKVSIPREHVSHVEARVFSRRRTALAAAAVGGGLMAFIVTRKIVASGRERDPTDPPGGPQTTVMPQLRVIQH